MHVSDWMTLPRDHNTAHGIPHPWIRVSLLSETIQPTDPTKTWLLRFDVGLLKNVMHSRLY